MAFDTRSGSAAPVRLRNAGFVRATRCCVGQRRARCCNAMLRLSGLSAVDYMHTWAPQRAEESCMRSLSPSERVPPRLHSAGKYQGAEVWNQTERGQGLALIYLYRG